MKDNMQDMQTSRYTTDELKDMIARYVDPHRVPRKFNIVSDTSNFFKVDYDDVVVLNARPYLIRNSEREGRFGMDEQQKFWVKRAIDLQDGSMKIIKMVFLEKFEARIGDLIFDCVRSPKKEARILKLVKGHRNFMQGFSVLDSAGNIVRIIDFIPGMMIDNIISNLDKTHEDFFYNDFPAIFDDFIELVSAIKFLHDSGEKHGDIRRDHIIRGRGENFYRWIDFDYNYRHAENMFGYDLFGLGNVLIFLAGAGDVTTQDILRSDHPAFGRVNSDDTNIIFHNRIVNLKKIYPYIPDVLNLILLHF
ncbi:MAG: serine/threonine-protein kinase, partial [Nitrospirota bacterium]